MSKYEQEMMSFNMPSGLLNREIGPMLLELHLPTVAFGEKTSWTKQVLESGADSYSFTTREVDGYVFSIEWDGQDVGLEITTTPDEDNNTFCAAKVDTSYPPDERVRAELMGHTFALLKLVQPRAKTVQ